MKNINPWSLLRQGQAEQEEGLRLAEQGYIQDPDASSIMRLGVAYLWLKRYQSAWEHFYTISQTYPRSGDVFFGMAGVAKWCLDEPSEAISMWLAGLKAKYARTAGLSVILPQLLFFASVVKPETYERKKAERLLLEKTTDLRIQTWPGPIAKLLLDKISQNDFQTMCKGNNESDTKDRLWLTEFYQCVLAYDPGNISTFKQAMQELTDTSQPKWFEESIFLRRIWQEEFFLARHEAK